MISESVPQLNSKCVIFRLLLHFAFAFLSHHCSLSHWWLKRQNNILFSIKRKSMYSNAPVDETSVQIDLWYYDIISLRSIQHWFSLKHWSICLQLQNFFPSSKMFHISMMERFSFHWKHKRNHKCSLHITMKYKTTFTL